MNPPFIIADKELAAKLEQVTAPVPICAPDGRVLVYASPAKPAQFKLEPQVSEEELARREQEPARKLTDILRDLEARP